MVSGRKVTFTELRHYNYAIKYFIELGLET